MAFTSGNDLNILQSTDSVNVGAGAGDDKYILTESVLTPGQEITLTDAEGSNTLQLIGGLTIASSVIAANALQLTLSNGAVINVFGADQFSYEIGGNPLTGEAGSVQDYATFVTTSLGADAVPETGVVNGASNVQVNEDGTTEIPVPAIDLPVGSTDPVNATEAAEIFAFDVAAAQSITEDTQIILNDFDVINDALKIDSATAAGNITLDALNGIDGIAVQPNVITQSTLIGFGPDADGDVIALTLAGIVDPTLVNVEVI